MDGENLLTKTFILVIVISLLSCQSKEEQLIGHWHEYQKGNPDFLSCHKITDSTYSLDSETYGGSYVIKRGVDIKKNEIAINGNYFYSSDFSISNNKIIVNDSIYWIKQEDNKQTFISDFSSGLLVNIVPFETKLTKFDYKKNTEHLEILIYIGKLKKSMLSSFEEYNSKEYYVQLNDKISYSTNDIRSFLITECDLNGNKEDKILLHMDKDTPVELTNKIETEILNSGYKKNQIYYLTVNLEKKLYGYNYRN